jgi:predicted nucleotidyltransferase
MGKRNDKIRLTIHDFLNRLNETGLRVEKAYLFGSQARGNAREWSDIDIAVISKSFSGNRFDDMMSLFENKTPPRSTFVSTTIRLKSKRFFLRLRRLMNFCFFFASGEILGRVDPRRQAP